MAIFIGRRPEAGFTRVPNEWARDPKLTTKAKGLLLYLLSHQDGYQLSLKQVIAENADGRDAIYKTLAELAERGYVRREQRRRAGGTVGEVDYYVADAQVSTASGFTASGESGSGHDQGKQDVSAGGTASWNTVSGSAVSGKSATKKTRDKKTKNQEDQKTTSPNPSADVALVEVVDAEIVEEGEGSDSSLKDQVQKLIDEAVAAKPNWRSKRPDIRAQIDALLMTFGGSFDLAARVVRETALAADTGWPSRITLAQNPAMQRANAVWQIARLDALGDSLPVPPVDPRVHEFNPDRSGLSCKACPLPKANGVHRVPAPRRSNRHVPYRDPVDISAYETSHI